jgi:hypothetical protein
VIGRFVEQQQAWLGGEGLGEEAAALEAAREVIELTVLREAEAGNQVVDPEVFFPIFRMVVGAETGGHDVAHVAREALGNLLGQAGYADAVRDGDRTRVRGGFARGDAHEGGLAGTISAEQTDPLTFLDLEVEMVKDGRAAEADIDVEETE